MSKNAKIVALAATALMLAGLSCAASTGSSPLDARAEAGARPKTSGYPAVEDLPQPREKAAMTPDERSKLQKELIGARDRQASRAKAKEGAASSQSVKP
jgi:hypothetical protein